MRLKIRDARSSPPGIGRDGGIIGPHDRWSGGPNLATTPLGALPRLTSRRAVATALVFVYHLGRWDVWKPLAVVELGDVGVGVVVVRAG